MQLEKENGTHCFPKYMSPDDIQRRDGGGQDGSAEVRARGESDVGSID
jgi:hypothetical protein